MTDFPATDKGLKQRISSYRRSLTKEKQTHNHIDDSYGKRYLLFCLYLLLGDHSKVQDYFDWYEREFFDDVGESSSYRYYNRSGILNDVLRPTLDRYTQHLRARLIL